MRRYEKKLDKQLSMPHARDFFVERLRNEWDEIEHDKRRKELIDLTKYGAKMTGKVLLGMLLLAGVITVSVAAPNVFCIFGRNRKYRRYLGKKQFQTEIRYLSRRNYIVMPDISLLKRGDGQYDIRITHKGKQRLVHEYLRDLKLSRPEKWDGKWRIVIFDIPDRHKGARDGFRGRLQAVGMHRLQESVFISSFPCRKEVGFLCWLFGVTPYIHFIETDSLSNDDELRDLFQLV